MHIFVLIRRKLFLLGHTHKVCHDQTAPQEYTLFTKDAKMWHHELRFKNFNKYIFINITVLHVVHTDAVAGEIVKEKCNTQWRFINWKCEINNAISIFFYLWTMETNYSWYCIICKIVYSRGAPMAAGAAVDAQIFLIVSTKTANQKYVKLRFSVDICIGAAEIIRDN